LRTRQHPKGRRGAVLENDFGVVRELVRRYIRERDVPESEEELLTLLDGIFMEIIEALPDVQRRSHVGASKAERRSLLETLQEHDRARGRALFKALAERQAEREAGAGRAIEVAVVGDPHEPKPIEIPVVELPTEEQS
jgi:hypothetical protein